MTIRPAQNRDIPGLIALLRQVGQVHHEIRPDLFRAGAQKYRRPQLEALLQDPRRPIFTAEEDGQVVGYAFCVLQEVKDDPALTDRRSLYIDDLCVDRDHRCRGIATALYQHVCRCAREAGCQAVTLNVWSGNDAARRFYDKCGMRPQKTGMECIL